MHSLIKNYRLTSDFFIKTPFVQGMPACLPPSSQPLWTETPPPIPQPLLARELMIHSRRETNWKSMWVAQAKWEWGIGGCSPLRAGGGGGAQTPKHRGNIVPDVRHSPQPLFIVYKWAGINSFNLELHLLTLACLPTPGHWLSPPLHTPSVDRSIDPTVMAPVLGSSLGGFNPVPLCTCWGWTLPRLDLSNN